MMVFEHSSTPVARQLKMLVYGGAGTGKTWFALHAPDPLIIDTESSTDAYRGQPTLPPFTVAKSARPSEIIPVLEQLASRGYIQNGAQKLQPQTLVIDSFSLLWQVSQEAGQKIAERRAAKYKKPVDEARLAFGDWSLIKRPIQRLYTQLLNLPVHVIVTARQKDLYDDSSSEPRKIGEAPDIERNAVYNFDLVLKLELEGNGKRVGVVEKSRFADFPPGTRLQNPAWDLFAHLARSGEQPSQNIDLDATAEQEACRMEPPADWTRNPANVAKAAQYLADNGLGDIEANAALDTPDWRKTHLSADGFKAAIEAYVAQHSAPAVPAKPRTKTPPSRNTARRTTTKQTATKQTATKRQTTEAAPVAAPVAAPKPENAAPDAETEEDFDPAMAREIPF